MKKALPVIAIVVAVAVGIGVFLFARKSAAKKSDEKLPEDESGSGSKDSSARLPAPSKEPAARQPSVPSPEVVAAPVFSPKPGQSPSNPLPGDELYSGFEGYFLVVKNMYLSHYAQRLGIGGTNWRQIRDHKQNSWLKALANSATQKIHGFNLVPRYTKNAGVDCVAPGYKANILPSNTGQYPVVFWSK